MSADIHLLVVEDDAEISRLLTVFLQTEGYVVDVCQRGDQAPLRVRQSPPDLIILDILLPGQDGLQVCQQIRAFYDGPVLMLTACDDDISELTAFRSGADDYVRKPIRPDVLLMRIQALLKRCTSRRPTVNEYRSGPLRIVPGRREVLLNDKVIEIQSAEFDLLELLARHQGQAVSRDRCFRALRGIDYDGSDRSLDMRISSLRKRLADSESPRIIKTVRGVGYMLANDETR
ncbi:MAG: response regulator transcription factor [Gammaproteobacteria bacterium]|uniref:Transcriptional regulatory protein YycF n=1 Tax=Marinobacter litoralis TaxID=187981 RepID=A0A3M2R8K8_9GAMM|nr:response regulator transcription factor [Marinobacter litoralis]MBR9871661.1 response regulator transcription factor [Gammaproteobacteria bacterium]RMJ01571.1 Transcriptional regulatory protein YycF [Marinobacter litoralis]